MLTFTGQALARTLKEEPALTLSFYSYGILLRKRMAHGTAEYPISPVALAALISEQAAFDTGFISPGIIRVIQAGSRQMLVACQEPQLTHLLLDGSESPLAIPLPGLVLTCQVDGEKRVSASVWAVKGRPTDGEEPLFHAPLPNVYPGGGICFGDVVPGKPGGASPGSLWDAFLGTAFGNHLVSGKSRKHPDDIRQQLLALEGRRRYPIRDLVPTGQTLAGVLP